ncbi:MAG: DUF3108 domain-containing protein [Alphaproteobacteria bacterium]|nr:MAG: DUF3108 domain-containing protein [Alphaproteobacteria bacterium]
MFRLLAKFLGFSAVLVLLMSLPASAKTKEEKLAEAAKAAELAEEMTALLYEPAFPRGQDPDTTFDIEYVVYWGGFHLATLEFIGSVRGGEYQIRTLIETEGVADALLKSKADIGSKGDLEGSLVRPVLYNSDITDSNRRQLVSMTYSDHVPGDVLSFPEYNLERFPVEAKLKPDTVDPISAIMYILAGSAVTEGNPCGGKIPIFDGRRRFDMALEYIEHDTVSTGRKGAYKGEALKCWVGYKKIAGFKPAKTARQASKEAAAKSNWPDVYMWLVPHDSSLLVPVRIQAENNLGAFIARAVKMDITTRTELAGGGGAPYAPLPEADVR